MFIIKESYVSIDWIWSPWCYFLHIILLHPCISLFLLLSISLWTKICLRPSGIFYPVYVVCTLGMIFVMHIYSSGYEIGLVRHKKYIAAHIGFRSNPSICIFHLFIFLVAFPFTFFIILSSQSHCVYSPFHNIFYLFIFWVIIICKIDISIYQNHIHIL